MYAVLHNTPVVKVFELKTYLRDFCICKMDPAIGRMYGHIIVVAFAIIFGVDAICNFPDYNIKRGLYRKIIGPGTGAVVNFTSTDPSTFTVVSTGDTVQCIEDDSGMFSLTRRLGTNQYICNKQIDLRRPETGGLALVYGGEYKEYKYTPSLCEVCQVAGKWSQSLYVADNLNNNDLKGSAEELPPLGSKVPKKCSVYTSENDNYFNQLWEYP